MISARNPILLLALLPLVPSCATVEVKPIKVEPIHVVVDINLRVDRQLDEFFAFEDQFAPPATQPAGAPSAAPSAAPASPAATSPAASPPDTRPAGAGLPVIQLDGERP